MAIAHERQRQITSVFQKKMKFSPIVSIQGPRQCGKSYFARKLAPQKFKNIQYYTFDQKETRSFAQENPRSFLTQNENLIIAIDEVQKVPDIFDEIKSLVDEKRKPGQFIILGSTEFSHETQIRESLTGRLSRVRLYPFNLSETLKTELNPSNSVPFILNKPRVSRAELLRYLKNGGLPGIFNVKSEEEKMSLFSDWISLTVERDIHQIKKFKLDSEVALQVLQSICLLEEPTAANISKALSVNPKKINSYLVAFKTLFVIFEVLPFEGSTGKAVYFLTDVGLTNHFGASFQRKLQTWFYLELYSQISYKGYPLRPLYFYRSAKGSFVDLMYIQEKTLEVVKLIPSEKYDERDFFIFQALKKKYSSRYSLNMSALSGTSQRLKAEVCTVWPWESLA
jgi:predicted AAA+ superfamily ATPase